jgi:hypothetical protein
MRRSIHLCGQNVDQPGHICAFFDSREEEYDTLLPYFKEGVEAGEQVLNVLDAERLPDHCERLEAGGIPIDDGRVQVASSEETYIAGGSFDIERMVSFVTDAVRNAAASGKLVRTAGWMDWVYRQPPGTERLMEYEARMNLLVPTFDCTFMCVYDLSKVSGDTLIDIMSTHPYVILRGQIRRNPFFIRPEEYLRELVENERRSSS